MNFDKLPESAASGRRRPRRWHRWLAPAGVLVLGAVIWAWLAPAGSRVERPVATAAPSVAAKALTPEEQDRNEQEAQSAFAAPSLAEAAGLDGQVAAHLRRREIYQARVLLGRAVALLEEVRVRAPRARGMDGELRLRTAWLHLQGEELMTVQDMLYDALRPSRTGEEAAVLRVCVPQALFRAVMNSNPSREGAGDGPVDSITYAEALEFCRRLGWMLGRPVRLPVEEEIRTVAGRSAEWLQDDPGGSETAPVWRPGEGVGRATSSVRDRMHSFRVVVGVNLADPAR